VLRLGHQARTIAPGGRPRLNYLRQNTRLLRFALLLRGNPLALLELVRGLTPAELAGGFGLPRSAPISGQIEEAFLRRIDALPAQTRRLLLVAAADPAGDPALVWPAAGRLGISAQVAAPAAEAGLAEFGAWVLFRHPLVRSAAYRSASLQDRQDVHRASGGHRPADRSRPPRLAPGAGRAGARRGGRRGAGALGRPGAGARGPDRGGRASPTPTAACSPCSAPSYRPEAFAAPAAATLLPSRCTSRLPGPGLYTSVLTDRHNSHHERKQV
jgi:hypothetical protein